MRISEFKDPFTGRRGYYMFTTDHQPELLIFRTTEDFTFGVNTLAIGTWVLLRLAQMLKTRYGIKGVLKA